MSNCKMHLLFVWNLFELLFVGCTQNAFACIAFNEILCCMHQGRAFSLITSKVSRVYICTIFA